MMDRDLNEGTIYPSTSDIHEDELKALSIPKSFDFGTVLIELTCLDVSTSYIIAGSACGALFVFNRKLSKMARPLRTNPFEHVSCIQQFNYVDDFVAVGHSTGSLVALRLPSSREGGSTSLAQCVDFDCHRRSSITCVAWNSDGTKIVSGNENGTVILSLVDFDKNEFKHNFVFEGCCSINTICLSYNSVIVHSDSKFNAIDIETFSSRRLVEIENSCDRQFVVKVRERKGTLLVVDNKKIVAYSPDFTKVVNTNEFKELGFTDHIIRAICTEDQLAVLTDNGYLAVFSIDPFVIIWKKKFQQELVHNFSLDIDGSVLYILKKRSIIRIGPNAVDYRLLKPNQESSAISTLLASPKKLFSSNVMKIATESGRSLINSAISIGIKVEVPKLPQDGINRVNIKQDLSNIMQTVQNFVDTSNQSFEEGIAITKTGQTNRSSSVEKLAVNNDLMVHRKEKGKRKKKFTEEEHENREEPSVSSERNVDLIETLRREILGDLFDGRPQSIESLTSISSLVTSPHDEVSTDEIENSGIISHFNTKDSSDCQNSCLSNGSSSPSTCEHNNYFSPITDSPIRKIKQVTNDELNTNEYDIMNVHTENFIKTSHEDQKFDLEAESSTLAYDYLIQKSSTYRNVNFESCLNITGQSPINHNGISEQYCHQSAVLNDRLDIWVSINLPFNAKAFTASSKHIIICHKKKNPRFIPIEKLGTKKLDWVVTNWKADYVDINDDESLFWRIHKNIGWSACEALCEGTNYTESATDGGGVKEVALRGHDAWYITKEGVSLQMELPHKAIFYRVDCDFPLCSITVSEDAVWAIRIDTGQLVVRVGLNKCRMGLDWVEICPDGPSRLRSICLFRSNGFALDCNGSLWMTNGVDLHHPYGNSIWYKICTPINTEITSMEQAVVKISSAGVFICIGRLLYLSRCALSGHRFLREVPTKYEIIDSFTFISCRSLSQNGLDIFLCRENSEMYIYRPMRRNFITRAMPPACVAVVGITSRQDVVSVIDSCGYVYSWVEGDVEWKRDDLLRVPICSISYSRISSWAVTCDGDILVKIGTENKWTTVVPPEMNGNKVTQVAVSPNGFFIWILSGGRAWARVGVNGRNLAGISWSQTFHCSDLCCVAVGDNVVWALDSEGILLRLRGLAAGNPAGNYWMNIAQSFRKIACDLDSCLWAIDIDNRLTRHSADLYIPKILPSFRPQVSYNLV